MTSFIVTNALQREEIDKLRHKLKEMQMRLGDLNNLMLPEISIPQASSSNGSLVSSSSYSRLLYVKVSSYYMYSTYRLTNDTSTDGLEISQF